MEVVVYLTKLLGEHWLVLGGLSLGSFVLGSLLFGRGYKKRIAALEARASMPAINQTFNFNAGPDAQDHDRQLRDAIETNTTQNLKETINRLPQHPLSDGHTYATLPNGTNIVTMDDGSIRLALPVRLSALGVSAVGSLSAAVLKTSPPERGEPDELGADPDLGEKT